MSGSPPGENAGVPGASAWRSRRERGSPFLIRFMAALSLRLGRAPARALLHLIAAYFLATSGNARRASYRFLSRALGRAPSLAERYRHFLCFATTIHDRVFFVADRFDPFDISVHGSEPIEEMPAQSGVFLMGSHLGSFEAIRACGRSRECRPVVMAMVEENARKLNATLAAINPRALEGIVALGRLESMLKLREHLDHGAMVGMLADRTPGNEPTLTVPFLGEAASFPTGPMRMAAILRCPVFFMAGLYAGGNRYDIHFEKIADFSGAPVDLRGARARLVAEAVARYAGRLEHYARLSPFNWFNFHDFWSAPLSR